MEFIGIDANGTDGSNAAIMSLVYEFNGTRYRIPADTPVENRQAAVLALAGSTVSEAADMIASFTGNGAALIYFNALQKAIRDVSTNNSIDIATVFPAMKALLDDDAGLYQRYLNLLRIATGISQATFEGTPTTAQQRNAFIVALEFANTGIIQTLFSTLHG